MTGYCLPEQVPSGHMWKVSLSKTVRSVPQAEGENTDGTVEKVWVAWSPWRINRLNTLSAQRAGVTQQVRHHHWRTWTGDVVGRDPCFNPTPLHTPLLTPCLRPPFSDPLFQPSLLPSEPGSDTSPYPCRVFTILPQPFPLLKRYQ